MSEYSHVEVVHYRVCSVVHSTVGETANVAHEGFNETDKFLTIFLFMYLFLSELQYLFLSTLSNKNHDYFIPELVAYALSYAL
jgi:hypothetical protein